MPRALVPNTALAALLLVAVALAGPAVQGKSGGTVSNKVPTVEAFSNAAASRNDGDVEVLTGEVRDRNGETDIQSIQIGTISGPSVGTERIVAASDLLATSEPAAFDAAGWKIWNAVVQDGRLDFRFQYAYPVEAAATYVWQAEVSDEAGPQTGPASTVTVQVLVRLAIAASPVLSNGATDPTGTWGGWNADAGQALVEATNYLKIVNTGATATQAFAVDFTQSAYVGDSDSSYCIPVDGNIEFAWWEDATPSTTAPLEGSYVFQSASSTGSATISFTGLGNVMYVTYRIVELPDPLLDQAYEASYIVTAV